MLYTPAADFVGAETFSYTIKDSVEATATATVTVHVDGFTDDDAFVVFDDGQIYEFDVLQNDGLLIGNHDELEIDPVSDVMNVSNSPSTISNSTAEFSADKRRIIYQRDQGNLATETFTYQVVDDAGGTSSATVTVTVDTSGAPANEPPVALDDRYSATIGQSLVIGEEDGLVSNDVDFDAQQQLSVTKIGGVSIDTNPIVLTYGVLTISADGSFTYAANSSTAGDEFEETFNYTLSDGRVGGEDVGEVSILITRAFDVVDELEIDPVDGTL